MEYLNTIKRHPVRIFMKFQRDKGSFETSFYVKKVGTCNHMYVQMHHKLNCASAIIGYYKNCACEYT